MTYVRAYDKLISVDGWKTSTPPKLIKEGGEDYEKSQRPQKERAPRTHQASDCSR